MNWKLTRLILVTVCIVAVLSPAALAQYDSGTAVKLPIALGGNGLYCEYYEGTWYQVLSFTGETPVRTGYTNNFVLDMAGDRTEYFALRFTGYISVPSDGTYTFYLGSDDGSHLYINDNLIVDNDGAHEY